MSAVPGTAGVGQARAGQGAMVARGGSVASGGAGLGAAAAGTRSAPANVAGTAGRSGATSAAAGAGSGASAAGSGAGAAGSSNVGAAGGSNVGAAGSSAGAGGSAAAGRAGSSGAAADSGESASGLSPVYRIPLRVHTAMSELTQAELTPILQEMNKIWLEQAGICFEIEVTASETNREDGFDFRYTSGEIPIARGSNGVFQNAHSIWSIDHPRLNDVMMPVTHPTARTTAHELGHALGLAHENPPPSNDCSRPCHCVELGDDCDEYLMRSGSKGFFLSMPEIEITRERAPRVAVSDQAPTRCSEPTFMP